jgi:hypothetical protein
MLRQSCLLIAIALAPTIAVAQGSICNPCVDGPEMLKSRRLEAAPIVSIEIRCESGPIQRTFGGTDWLVSECDDGSLQLVTAPQNPAAPYSFTLWRVGDTYELPLGRPRGRVARAAYRDLLSLDTAKINELLRELRAHVDQL